MVDQLFTMLLELLENKKITLQNLADRMNVSKRTVLRYADIMSVNNIPIVSERGKYGGIRIGEEFMLSNNYFTKSEMSDLKTAVIQYLNNGENGSQNLLLKLNSISNKVDTHSLTHVVTIQNHDKENIINDKIQIIDTAIISKNYLSIHYHARNGEVSVRTIAPLNFIVKDGEWFVYCYCNLRMEYRTFKLTRISHITTLSDVHSIPGNYPRKWQFDFSEEILLQLEVLPKAKYLIEEWLGVEALTPMQSGNYKVIVSISYTQDLVYKLLSFGDGIVIISPRKIIDDYLRIIENIKGDIYKTQ